MLRYVVITLYLIEPSLVEAPPPLKLAIDCSKGSDAPYNSIYKPRSHQNSNNQYRSDSFCSLIHNSIPEAVKDGKFLLIRDPDQSSFGNEPISISVLPPKGFIPKFGPKFKIPKVRVPKLKVPRLKTFEGPLAPRVGSPMRFGSQRDSADEESSAERMERFKKGVQKMLHVVKVLGQIDQYLSERTRIIVDKLAKTFSE
ncbi:uncharacterized protein LOC113240111 [Hyposmocoma kahamanoa]|uniref:uncharacterized protein LOC113240111 n=1 Tax=Hyposmocoma kahamanoa TaxID=1477025 RepID=UPI000E6D7E84|nr:uncharacterized protein LOC113240111 [Hyposmocoma kahamanoa]